MHMHRMNPPSRNIRDSASRNTNTNPTSLPSIHQLHPYLPQSPQSSTSASTYVTNPYAYPHGNIQNLYNASSASSSQQTIEEQRSYDQQYGARRSSMRSIHPMEEEGIGGESDLEGEGVGGEQRDRDRDLQEPPKKKRRRQALSCTECKRRKIKCDRSQPCGPCMKRGEPDRCQWHIVEPTDKYVSRTEWEELHSRYTRLESRYERLENVFLELHPELSHRLSPTLSPAGSRHSRISSHSTSREIPPPAVVGSSGTNYAGPQPQRTPPQTQTHHHSSPSHISFGSSSTSYSEDNTRTEQQQQSSILLRRRPSLIILEPEIVPSNSTTHAHAMVTIPLPSEDNTKSRYSPISYSGESNQKNSSSSSLTTEPMNTSSSSTTTTTATILSSTSRASPLSLTSIISGPVMQSSNTASSLVALSSARVFSPPTSSSNSIAEKRERRQRSP